MSYKNGLIGSEGIFKLWNEFNIRVSSDLNSYPNLKFR